MSTVPGLREMIAEPESEKSKTAVQSESTDGDTKKEWPTAYDGKKREPEYANAQNSCLWELVSFLSTVSIDRERAFLLLITCQPPRFLYSLTGILPWLCTPSPSSPSRLYPFPTISNNTPSTPSSTDSFIVNPRSLFRQRVHP